MRSVTGGRPTVTTPCGVVNVPRSSVTTASTWVRKRPPPSTPTSSVVAMTTCVAGDASDSALPSAAAKTVRSGVPGAAVVEFSCSAASGSASSTSDRRRTATSPGDDDRRYKADDAHCVGGGGAVDEGVADGTLDGDGMLPGNRIPAAVSDASYGGPLAFATEPLPPLHTTASVRLSAKLIGAVSSDAPAARVAVAGSVKLPPVQTAPGTVATPGSISGPSARHSRLKPFTCSSAAAAPRNCRRPCDTPPASASGSVTAPVVAFTHTASPMHRGSATPRRAAVDTITHDKPPAAGTSTKVRVGVAVADAELVRDAVGDVPMEGVVDGEPAADADGDTVLEPAIDGDGDTVPDAAIDGDALTDADGDTVLEPAIVPVFDGVVDGEAVTDADGDTVSDAAIDALADTDGDTVTDAVIEALTLTLGEFDKDAPSDGDGDRVALADGVGGCVGPIVRVDVYEGVGVGLAAPLTLAVHVGVCVGPIDSVGVYVADNDGLTLSLAETVSVGAGDAVSVGGPNGDIPGGGEMAVKIPEGVGVCDGPIEPDGV